MQAPKPVCTRDTHVPVPATIPTNCCKRTSVRSDKEPNPRVRTKPTSNPSPVPRPNVRCDTVPSQEPQPEPTPDRSPAPSPNVRKYRDLRNQRNSGWYFPKTQRRGSYDRDRYSMCPMYLSPSL